MGSVIELNDTLQYTREQGFPADVLDLAKHQKTPITLDEVKDKIFSFYHKESARFYQSDPVRVFLVQNIGGKWLFWGKIYVQSQTITKTLDDNGNWTVGKWETAGTFKIVDIYEPAYQELFTKRESPLGLSYF